MRELQLFQVLSQKLALDKNCPFIGLKYYYSFILNYIITCNIIFQFKGQFVSQGRYGY